MNEKRFISPLVPRPRKKEEVELNKWVNEIEPGEQEGAKPLEASQFEGSSLYSKMEKDAFKRQQFIVTELYTDIIREREGLEAALDQIDTLEAMSVGKEVSGFVVGDAESGVNVTRCVTFEKGVVGFAKSGKGEAVLSKGGVIMGWDERAKQYIAKEEINDAGIKEISSERYKANMLSALKESYGLTDEETEKLSKLQFGNYISVRPDIPPRESVVHEMAIGQLAQLCGFKRFPQTILRKQDDEVVSVQEGAKSKIPGEKLKPFNEYELEKLMETPYEKWPEVFGEEAAKELKRSMDEGAIATVLFGFQDLGANNILGNMKTGEMTFIDSSLSFGLLRGKQIKDETVAARAFRSIRSLPLEVYRKNKGMKLNEESLATLKELYKNILTEGRKEKKMLEDLLKTMCPNLKIAQGQLKEFFLRLKSMVDTGELPAYKELDDKWENSAQETIFSVTQLTIDTARLNRLREQSEFDGDVPEVSVEAA